VGQAENGFIGGAQAGYNRQFAWWWSASRGISHPPELTVTLLFSARLRLSGSRDRHPVKRHTVGRVHCSESASTHP
jgi:hypothetical protein